MKELIYKLIDVFTGGKGLKKSFHNKDVRLPTRFINYFPSNYEAENFTFLEKQLKPGAVVLDIGAHIGLFAVVAAKMTGARGKIYAFEPSPATKTILEKTIAINQLGQTIFPVAEAMSKEVGTITFFVSDNEADNGNSLVSYKDDRKLEGINVPVNTIDHFTAERKLSTVDFIKIDVEGAEYDTLRGGAEVFAKYRPACILSIHPIPIKVKGDKLEDIYDHVQLMNYGIYYDDKPMTKAAFCANEEMIDLHILPL
ncbi:MAG: fkbM [Ferruginibacter sp.]|nr:fkbM [Ferruginibacter sp.]